jgi:mono/diheme cytochrome c family protein
MKNILIAGLLALAMLTSAFAGSRPSKEEAASPGAVVSSSSEADEGARLEGEKRFRANCGRCHQAPHKFPPRMMATIERHMRVRALITDEDLHFILRYMTQ